MKHRKKRKKPAASPKSAAPPSTPESRAAHATQSMSPPDIPALARLGGLPADISPYQVRAFRDALHVSASGNSTATVNECVAIGLSIRVEDARQVHLQYGQKLAASELKSLVNDLEWVEDEWIQEKVIAPREIKPDKLGAELQDKLVTRIPVLQEWDELAENIKRGQIVETLYGQMAEVARIVVKDGKTFNQARESTPHFKMLWQRFDALDNSLQRRFSDINSWGRPRTRFRLPNRYDILETIGSIFFAQLGPYEILRSLKAFRSWRKIRHSSEST